MESTGIPLGIYRDWTFHKSEPIKLVPENVLVYFSDGIIELFHHGQIEICADRAIDSITQNRQGSARQILESLFREVRDYSERHHQVDDMTCVICKVVSSPGLPSDEGSELGQIPRENPSL